MDVKVSKTLDRLHPQVTYYKWLVVCCKYRNVLDVAQEALQCVHELRIARRGEETNHFLSSLQHTQVSGGPVKPLPGNDRGGKVRERKGYMS